MRMNPQYLFNIILTNLLVFGRFSSLSVTMTQVTLLLFHQEMHIKNLTQ